MTHNSSGQMFLTRPFLVDHWRDDEAFVAITADAGERAALATAFGLAAIAALTAEFTLTRRGRGRIDVNGRMAANVTQICVVSLDPFETEISEPIAITFAPEEEARAAEARVAADLEVRGPAAIEGPPDPIIEGRIDLGALAAEFLALGLDPYPRKPGVDFAAPTDAPLPAASPFAVLGQLHEKKEPPEE